MLLPESFLDFAAPSIEGVELAPHGKILEVPSPADWYMGASAQGAKGRVPVGGLELLLVRGTDDGPVAGERIGVTWPETRQQWGEHFVGAKGLPATPGYQAALSALRLPSSGLPYIPDWKSVIGGVVVQTGAAGLTEIRSFFAGCKPGKAPLALGYHILDMRPGEDAVALYSLRRLGGFSSVGVCFGALPFSTADPRMTAERLFLELS